MGLCRSPMGLCITREERLLMPLTYGLDDVRGVASFSLSSSSSFQSNSINYNISIGQIFNVMTQKKLTPDAYSSSMESNGSVSLLASQMVPGVKNLILNLDINLNCKSLSLNYISITSTILIIFNCICLVTKQSGDR